jgi:enoyl-CoA hydratase/carnithine racemase
VIILSGKGDGAFSAGMDLLEMKDLTPSDAESLIRLLHQGARKLLTMAVPAIAAIRGPCLGGALEVAFACDVRVAGQDALLGLPEVRVGIPSVIEASLLPRTIGLGRACQMLLSGSPVNAQEALEIGLVDRVVAPEEVMSTAIDLAKDLLGMSRDVLASQKAIVAKWLEVSEEESNEFSIQEFIKRFKTTQPKEAMEAYLEKRPPRF